MQTKLSKRKDGFSTPLGVIIVVGLLAVCGFVLNLLFAGRTSQTTQFQLDVPHIAPSSTNQTTTEIGWKSYNNSQYGYSFKYPQDLFLDATAGERSRTAIITNFDGHTVSPSLIEVPAWPGILKMEFTVLFQLKPDNVDLLTYIESLGWYPNKTPYHITEGIHYISFTNSTAVERAVSIQTTNTTGLLRNRYILLDNNKVLAISIMSAPPLDPLLPTSILNTFTLMEKLP